MGVESSITIKVQGGRIHTVCGFSGMHVPLVDPEDFPGGDLGMYYRSRVFPEVKASQKDPLYKSPDLRIELDKSSFPIFWNWFYDKAIRIEEPLHKRVPEGEKLAW